MLKQVLTLSVLLVLVSLPLGSASLHAQSKTLADYDLKTLAIVVNRDSSDITFIDTKTDTIINRIPLGQYTNAHMAMLNHDGKKLLISGTGRDRFLVVDPVTGKVEHTVITGKAPEHFDVTHDGRRAFVGNIEDSTVSIIDVPEGREVQRVTGFYEPHGFSVTPDGSKVYISSLGAHEVAVLDANSGRIVKRLAVGNVGRVAARDPQRYLSEIKGIVNPTLTKDGAFVYAADSDAGELAIIDTKTDQIVKKLKVGAQPWRAYNSPDGHWMLVPNNGDATVSVIDTTSQKIVAQLTAGSEMTGINFALDGKSVCHQPGRFDGLRLRYADLWPGHAPQDRHQSGAGDGVHDGGWHEDLSRLLDRRRGVRYQRADGPGDADCRCRALSVGRHHPGVGQPELLPLIAECPYL
jgi:YVTN family beta-propeller protein